MIYFYILLYYLFSGVVCDLVYFWCNRTMHPQIKLMRELQLDADEYLWMPIKWPLELVELHRMVKAALREKKRMSRMQKRDV